MDSANVQSNVQSNSPANEAAGSVIVFPDDATLVDQDWCKVFSAAAEESLCQGPPFHTTRKFRKCAAYVVFRGHLPGVYFTWEAVANQINGYSGAVQRGFSTVEDAIAAWNHALATGTTELPDSSAECLVQTQPQVQEPVMRERSQAATPKYHRQCQSPSSRRNLAPNSKIMLGFYKILRKQDCHARQRVQRPSSTMN
ncbi:hypothetical protein C0992_000145 [Termitomyces sp. T32_za158]|nr:hypothetical protein C0992_000145 [Termitomyces sp. T32_za158]